MTNARKDAIVEAVANRRPLDDVLVIDAHAHLGPYDRFRIPHSDAAGMVETMDRIGIDKSCIFAVVACGPDYRRGNDMVGEAVAQFPDRLIGFVTIDPNDPGRVVSELERCAANFPVRGIKFHPGLHAYPAEGPNYRPAIEYANEKGIPVLSHSWSSPAILADLAGKHPNARFIAAHVAAAWDPRRDVGWFDVANEHPNVWLDLCSTVAHYGALEIAVRRFGADKLLYASDFPFMDATYQIGRVLYADITIEEKAKILGRNMENVFSVRLDA